MGVTVHLLERRRFLGALLAAVPALRLGGRAGPPQPPEAAGPQKPRNPVLVRAGEDRFHVQRAIGVSSTTFKVAADDSGRSLFAMEQANSRRGGPPLHVHREVDECWYVLAGEYLFEIGSERFRVGPGDLVLGPRDVPHRWAFVGDTPGRLLITFTPAGRMQEWFTRPRTPGTYADDPALFRRYGMELLGPPLKVE